MTSMKSDEYFKQWQLLRQSLPSTPLVRLGLPEPLIAKDTEDRTHPNTHDECSCAERTAQLEEQMTILYKT